MSKENPQRQISLLDIAPSYFPPAIHKTVYEGIIQVNSQLIRLLLDEKLSQIIARDEAGDSSACEEFYKKLNMELPLIEANTTTSDHFPQLFSISLICPSKLSQGIGRYLSDILSRSLIPGKQLTIASITSLSIHFVRNPKEFYFTHHLFLMVESKEDLEIAREHFKVLSKDLRLSILGVMHVRHLISERLLPSEEKRKRLEDQFAFMLNHQDRKPKNNLFEQLHTLLIKATAEERTSQIKERLAPIFSIRSELFKGDLFIDVQRIINLFKEEFYALRQTNFLTRIIAYTYIFRKNIMASVMEQPCQRHMSLKILRNWLLDDNAPVPTLSILLATSLLRDQELLEHKHLFSAILTLLPHVKLVENSSMNDQRPGEKIKVIYLEIQKEDGSTFSVDEIQLLRKTLPFEIKSRIACVTNPIFMPRNEEELMRNIIALSGQLRYVQDIPQVAISFHRQEENSLFFTVVIVRLFRPENLSVLSTLRQHAGEFEAIIDSYDTRSLGVLRKKHPKEGHVIELCLPKKPFLRKNLSLDLYEARRYIHLLLQKCLGEFRDYNGGMIAKQSENLASLKTLLSPDELEYSFLLENFFYSITPIHLQSLLPPILLKKLFHLLIEALHADYQKSSIFFSTESINGSLVILVAGYNAEFKDFFHKKLHASCSPIIPSCAMNTYDLYTFGYILRAELGLDYDYFIRQIQSLLDEWFSLLSVQRDPQLLISG